jgi:hypothetical protein
MFFSGSSKSSTDNIIQSVINAGTLFQGFIIEHQYFSGYELDTLKILQYCEMGNVEQQ